LQAPIQRLTSLQVQLQEKVQVVLHERLQVRQQRLGEWYMPSTALRLHPTVILAA